MCTELFRVPVADAKAPNFTLSEEQLKAYNPSAWFTSTELIDTVPSPLSIPTEDDLEVITNGIPISQLPTLTRWPSGPSSTSGSAGSASSAAGSESFAPRPAI
jgi:hypothetical protein